MANFEALIKATLETGNVQDQINKKINPLPVNLRNIQVDARSIQTQVQSALDNGSFQLNINGINLSGLNRQIQNVGTNAGNQFNNAFQRAIGRNSADRVRDMLSSHSMNDNVINKVVHNVERLGIALDRISGTERRHNMIDISVVGHNSLGETVESIQRFNAVTGEFAGEGRTRIVRSFTDMDAAIANVQTRLSDGSIDRAFSKIYTQYQQLSGSGRMLPDGIEADVERLQQSLYAMSQLNGADLVNEFRNFESISTSLGNSLRLVQSDTKEFSQEFVNLKNHIRDISKLEINIAKLDTNKDAEKISELTGQLNNARDAYENLRAAMNGRLSASQLSELDSFESQTRDYTRSNISSINAGKIDTSNAKESAAQFKRLYDIAKQMQHIEIDILKSDDVTTIELLRQRLQDLKTEYSSVKQNMSQKLSPEQFGKISSVFRETREQIIDTKNHIRELQAQLSKSIKFKLDTNEIDLAITKLEAKYNRLGGNGNKGLTSIQADLIKLRELEKNMGSQSGDVLAASWAEYELVLARVTNSLEKVSIQGDKLVSALDASKFKNQMSTWLDKNSRAAKDYGDSINAIIGKLEELQKEGSLTDSKMAELRAEFEGIKQAAISAGKVGKSFGTTLKNAFQGIFGVVSVATVLRQVTQLLKQMYQEVLAIDTAMVSLKKVTDETEYSYAKFLDRSASSAKELGRTISSFVEQTASWSKLGYNLSDAEELAKLSSVYSNVAEVDDATAVSDIVTALKAKRMPWFTEMCA